MRNLRKNLELACPCYVQTIVAATERMDPCFNRNDRLSSNMEKAFSKKMWKKRRKRCLRYINFVIKNRKVWNYLVIWVWTIQHDDHHPTSNSAAPRCLPCLLQLVVDGRVSSPVVSWPELDRIKVTAEPSQWETDRQPGHSLSLSHHNNIIINNGDFIQIVRPQHSSLVIPRVPCVLWSHPVLSLERGQSDSEAPHLPPC